MKKHEEFLKGRYEEILKDRAMMAKRAALYYDGKRDEHPAGYCGKFCIEDYKKMYGFDEYQAVTPRHMYLVTDIYRDHTQRPSRDLA